MPRNHLSNGPDSETEYIVHEITIIGNRPTNTNTVDTVNQRMLVMEKGSSLSNIIEKIQVPMSEHTYPEVRSDDEYINSGNNTARSIRSARSPLLMVSPQNAGESFPNENHCGLSTDDKTISIHLFDSENYINSSSGNNDVDQTSSNIYEKIQVLMSEQKCSGVRSDDEYINSGNNTARSTTSTRSTSHLVMLSSRNATEVLSNKNIANENHSDLSSDEKKISTNLFDYENYIKSSSGNSDGVQTNGDNIIEEIQVSMSEQTFLEVRKEEEYINSGNNTARSSRSTKSPNHFLRPSSQNASDGLTNGNVVYKSHCELSSDEKIISIHSFGSESDINSSRVSNDGDQTKEMRKTNEIEMEESTEGSGYTTLNGDVHCDDIEMNDLTMDLILEALLDDCEQMKQTFHEDDSSSEIDNLNIEYESLKFTLESKKNTERLINELGISIPESYLNSDYSARSSAIDSDNDVAVDYFKTSNGFIKSASSKVMNGPLSFLNHQNECDKIEQTFEYDGAIAAAEFAVDALVNELRGKHESLKFILESASKEESMNMNKLGILIPKSCLTDHSLRTSTIGLDNDGVDDFKTPKDSNESISSELSFSNHQNESNEIKQSFEDDQENAAEEYSFDALINDLASEQVNVSLALQSILQMENVCQSDGNVSVSYRTSESELKVSVCVDGTASDENDETSESLSNETIVENPSFQQISVNDIRLTVTKAMNLDVIEKSSSTNMSINGSVTDEQKDASSAVNKSIPVDKAVPFVDDLPNATPREIYSSKISSGHGSPSKFVEEMIEGDVHIIVHDIMTAVDKLFECIF